jgi:hypothetical protein
MPKYERTWTDAQLIEAAQSCATMPAICRAVGLTNTCKNRKLLKKRMAELGLPIPN